MLVLLKAIVRAVEKQYYDNSATVESYECVRKSVEKYNTTMSEIDILPEQELAALDAKKIILQIITDLRYSMYTWFFMNDDMNASYDSMYLTMIYGLMRKSKIKEFSTITSAKELTTKEYVDQIKENNLV